MYKKGVVIGMILILAGAYAAARPVIMHVAAPLLRQTSETHINGALTWETLELTPLLDFQFNGVVLKDQKGTEIFHASQVTAEWSLYSLVRAIYGGGTGISAVRMVDVVDPELFVKENQPDVWNVYSILKPVEKKTEESFVGSVRIENGILHVQPYGHEIYDFHSLHGMLSWEGGSGFKGHLDSILQGASVQAEGQYENDRNFQISLQTDALPAILIQSFLPRAAGDLLLQGGDMECTKGKIWKKEGILSYHVQGKAKELRASARGYTLTEGTGRFDVYDGTAEIEQMDARVDGQRFTGRLSLNWKNVPLSMHGQFSLHDVQVEKLFKDDKTKGILNGQVFVSGGIDDPVVSGQIAIRNGQYERSLIEKGKVSFSWEKKKLTLSDLDLLGFGGTLKGYGRWDLADGDFTVDLVGENVHLDNLPLSEHVEGAVTGHLAISGNGLKKTIAAASVSIHGTDLSWQDISAKEMSANVSYAGKQWQGDFYGEDAYVKGLRADSLFGRAEGVPDDWQIVQLNGTWKDGAFSARGAVKNQHMDLSLQAEKFDLSSVKELIGIDMGGTLSLKAKVQGTMEAPSFAGTVRAENGYVEGLAFQSVDGRIKSDGKQVTADHLVWRDKTGSHTIQGSVGLKEDHALQLSVHTENVRIENILGAAGLPLPVTGWVSNDVTLTGSLKDPVAQGSLFSWDGSAMGQLFRSIAVKYTLRNGTFQIDDGLAYMYGGAIHAAGRASSDHLDMEVAFIDVNAGELAGQKEIDGTVNMRGRLTGTPSAPIFDGYADSRRISFWGSDIHYISGNIHYENQVLMVYKGRFRQGEGQFTWNGGIGLKTGQMKGSLVFQKWNLSDAIPLFHLPVSRVKGVMSGSMEIGGMISNPEVSATVNIENGDLAGLPMNNGRIDLSYGNHILSVREFRIPIGAGLLAAKGYMYGDRSLDMQIATQDLDISWVPAVIGKETIRIGGVMTSGIFLKGSLDHPQADISIGIEHPQYGDFVFDSLSFMGNIQDNTLKISQALLRKEEYKASLYGSVPLNMITRVPSEDMVPVDLSVNLDHADLNTLALFFQPITSADGPIKGHLKIGGQWYDPQINGEVSVENGTMTIRGIEDPITNISGALYFKDEEADLEGQAVIGQGQMSVNGKALWNQGQLQDYRGEFHIHSPALNADLYKGALDADLVLAENGPLPKLSGNVFIHDAVFDVPYTMTAGGGALPIALDVNVNVGNAVRLYNPFLYDMTVSGNIHAGGTVSGPKMSGRVESSKGQIKYLSNVFNVDRGEASWGGMSDSFMPILYVLASSKVGHYTVGMELEGPPGGFQFNLHSDPPLNDQQIMMLLTLKQDPEGTNNNVDGALFNAGLQLAFSGGLESALKNTFGLDMVSMTSSLTDYYDSTAASANQDFYYVKIGKYLFRDFMVTATTGVNNEQQSIGFRYDLGSRFGISAWYNSEHDSYIGTEWKFAF